MLKLDVKISVERCSVVVKFLPSWFLPKVVHADSSIRADALTVLCVQKELRQWYAEHRKTLRSREQCFQFYLNLASGASVFKHVLDIGELTDAQLSKIGVVTNMEGNEAYAAKTLINHPMVALQDALVKRIFELKFAAQKHRLQGLVLFMFAYPWKLVLLAHPDQEARSLNQVAPKFIILTAPSHLDHTATPPC